jgi:hypothetical protein
MDPLLALLLTCATVVVLARRAHGLPALELCGVLAIVVTACIAAADDAGRTDLHVLAETALAGVVLGVVVVALLIALPLLALALLLEQHLHIKRVVAEVAAANDVLKAAVDRLAAELAAMRATPANGRSAPNDDDDDDGEHRRRRPRDEEAD